MSECLMSPFFSITLTIAAFWAGTELQNRSRLALCNNLLISMLLIIAVLKLFGIPYEVYDQGGSLINLLLGPATACMALGIYAKRDLLRRYWFPVLLGCAAGAVTAVTSILLLCKLFGLDRTMTLSLLPKSVTNPIATAISAGQGGVVSITVAAVIVTGIFGSVAAPLMIRLFRITDPMAAGLGIGACSHVCGTSKAIEIGETEGAMSSLAIGLCGIFTAMLALGFHLIV